MKRRSLVLGCFALAASGRLAAAVIVLTSSPSGAAAEASSLCQEYGLPQAQKYGNDISLSASYPVSANALTQWNEGRTGATAASSPPTVRFTSIPASEVVGVCYFSGTGFQFPGPPTNPPYRTLVLVVQPTGETSFDSVGPSAMPFSPPPTVAT